MLLDEGGTVASWSAMSERAIQKGQCSLTASCNCIDLFLRRLHDDWLQPDPKADSLATREREDLVSCAT